MYSMKLITFVVPAYNVQKYIGECLNSLLRQTSNNFEVIVVNDGSTDEKTEEICKAYVKRNPEVFHYIYQKNQGLGAARNAGLKLVKSPWVTFLDSDDWLVPDYVRIFQEEVEEFDSDVIDLFFTLPRIYDNVTGSIMNWYDTELFYSVFYENGREVRPIMDKRIYSLEVNACRKIYRMEYLEKIHFQFPVGVKWEDVFPHFFLLSNASCCVGIDKIGFYYRTNTSGQITASTGIGRMDIVKVFAQTFEYLFDNAIDERIIMIAMECCIKFSKWSIDISETEVRKKLVDRLYQLYIYIPYKYIYRYNRIWTRADRLFLIAIRSKIFKRLYYDYLIHNLVIRLNRRLHKKREFDKV